MCSSESESDKFCNHVNLGQQKTPGDITNGVSAFNYVKVTFEKTARSIATKIRYWNANAFGQIMPEEWTRLSNELRQPMKIFERMLNMSPDDNYERAARDADLPNKLLHVVYARLVGILYQAKDASKADEFCEKVLANQIIGLDPQLMCGESVNTISCMVMDEYARFCDPSFIPKPSRTKRDWTWDKYIPPISTWPALDRNTI